MISQSNLYLQMFCLQLFLKLLTKDKKVKKNTKLSLDILIHFQAKDQ